MKQKVLLLVVSMVLSICSAMANNKSDYYFKTTITASGAGTVYASETQDVTPEFQESVTLEPEKVNDSSAPTKTFYFWAQPEEGMEANWSTESSNVALTPSEDGLTATAIVTGNKDANTENIITVTFALPVAQKPTFGSTNNQTVFWPTLKVGIEAEEGATIYYTIDGSDPTTESTVYTDSILLERKSATIKAIAAVEGKQTSPIVSATYTIDKPAGNLVFESAALLLLPGETGFIAISEQSHEGEITWSSDNEDVLSINATTGEYTTQNDGVALVTATLEENEHGLSATATCQIRVKNFYQVQNSDFELWDDKDNDNIEPSHWNSFMHASGGFAGIVKGKQVDLSDEARPDSEGKYSAKLTARNLFIAVAQGNLTTGCINAASMSATDASGNYNYTKTDDDQFNQRFAGMPDSLRVWVKTSCKYGASVSCILHTEGYYQSPEANEITATVVATAAKSDIAATEWTELSIPMEYYEETGDLRPDYALITITTSGTAGSSDKNDWMLVDDLTFVYNSELEKATFGDEIVLFNEDGKAAVDEYYDVEMLNLIANGRGASIETNYDEETAELFITVRGDDYRMNVANEHLYSIQFRLYDGIHSIPGAKDNEVIYDLAGRRVQKPAKGGIYIVGNKKVLMK